MLKKKTLIFTEAWRFLKEEVKTDSIYSLEDDPDYGKTAPEFSFKDILLKLRNEYLNASSDEEQEEVMDKLQNKLIKLLAGNKWKIILKSPYKHIALKGSDFAPEVLFAVLEPHVEIVYASILAEIDNDF